MSSSHKKQDPFLDDSILFSTISKDPQGQRLKEDLQKLLDDHNNQSLMNETSASHFHHINNVQQEKENVTALTVYCNNSLEQFGFPQLGKLGGNNIQEQESLKTLNAVNAMLQQRQKDIDFRQKMVEIKAKVDSDNKMLRSKIDRLEEQYRKSQKQCGVFENQVQRLKQNEKVEMTKKQSDLLELQKNIKTMNQKMAQMQNELRKREVERDRAREQIRMKVGNDKQKFQNDGEQIQHLHNFRRQNLTNKQIGEIEYCAQICQNLETMNKQLLEENQQLRNGIAIIQNELNSVIHECQQNFISQRARDTQQNEQNLKQLYFGNLQLTNIGEGLFSMPFEKVGVQIISLFNDNFQTVKAFIEKMVSFNNSNNDQQNQSDIQAIQKNLAQFQQQLNNQNQQFINNNTQQQQKKSQQNQQSIVTRNLDQEFNHIQQQAQQNIQNNNFLQQQQQQDLEHDSEENKENVSVRISKPNSQVDLENILQKVDSIDNEDNSQRENNSEIFDESLYQNQKSSMKGSNILQFQKKSSAPTHTRIKSEVSQGFGGQSFLQKFSKKENYDTKSELSLSFVSHVSMKDVSEMHFEDKDNIFDINYHNSNSNSSNKQDSNSNNTPQRPFSKKPITHELKKWHVAFNKDN